MPRKVNKRKKLQAAQRKADKAATKKKHPARVGMIAHPGIGGAALAMALATMMKGGAR